MVGVYISQAEMYMGGLINWIVSSIFARHPGFHVRIALPKEMKFTSTSQQETNPIGMDQLRTISNKTNKLGQKHWHHQEWKKKDRI